MKAEAFYRSFEQGFSASPSTFGRRKLGGRTLRFKVDVPVGVLQFNFATNARAAGLLERRLWPGEFRLQLTWQSGRGEAKRSADVSIFQYTTGAENAAFADLQRSCLRKYLDGGGADPHGTLREQAGDRARLPRAGFEEWCYYTDTADAREWGGWYGGVFAPFIERFVERPESLEAWAAARRNPCPSAPSWRCS